MKYIIALLIFMMPTALTAHEMVPTYPKLEPSHLTGVYKTTLTMFNKRPEVEYYEIGVFTEQWEPVKFVSNYQIYKIPYLSTVTFDLYIRKQDVDSVTYICSVSKLRKQTTSQTAISSKICSKVKG